MEKMIIGSFGETKKGIEAIKKKYNITKDYIIIDENENVIEEKDMIQNSDDDFYFIRFEREGDHEEYKKQIDGDFIYIAINGIITDHYMDESLIGLNYNR